MQEIFKFLQQYWQVVLGAILFVVSLIIAIIRKKPISDIYSVIFKLCIKAVNVVEEMPIEEPLKSTNKLLTAIAFVYEGLCDYLGVENCPETISKLKKYQSVITATIEEILTTPQKKGE